MSESPTRLLPPGLTFRDGLPSPFHFPPDVVTIIIEHLQDTLPALKACTLTSWEWYRIARPHLYKVVNILENEKLRDVMETYAYTPEIGPWIKEIRLRFPQGKCTMLRSPYENVPEDNLVKKMADILANMFPKIHTLNVMSNLPGPLYLISFQALRSIQTVVLGKVIAYEIDLVMLLSHLPLVTTLKISGTYFVSAEMATIVRSKCAEAAPKRCRTIHLHTLDITLRLASPDGWGEIYPGEDILLPWLLKSPSRQTLRSVTIGMNEGRAPTPTDAGKFLSRLGSSLEELVLRPPRAKFYDVQKLGGEYTHLLSQMQLVSLPSCVLGHPITLSHLTGLRRLVLGDPLHPAVMSVLSSPILSLQRVEFDMTFCKISLRSLEDYESVDERLSCKVAFPSLKDVQISFGDPLREKVVLDVIRRFPSLSEKGILHVVTVRK